MVTIPNLNGGVPATVAANGDLFAMELSGGGTRPITRQNLMPRIGDLTQLTPTNIVLANDRVWFSDATDGFVKSISIQDLLFGNFTNLGVTDGFTLAPGTHNIRPVQCTGTFSNPNITLDGTSGGAAYLLLNFSTSDLTVVASGITMFSAGVSVASATLRENRSCSINVRNDGLEAIFNGG